MMDASEISDHLDAWVACCAEAMYTDDWTAVPAEVRQQLEANAEFRAEVADAFDCLLEVDAFSPESAPETPA